MVLLPNSSQLQKMRRVVQREFTGMVLQKYQLLYEHESRVLAANLLAKPEKSTSSIRQYATFSLDIV
jgi:hypothetical protein